MSYRIRKAFLVVLMLCMLPAYADDFVVSDIRVEGLNRISPGTVFNYLPVKVGERYTARRGQDGIHALFKTGFFQDVKFSRDGDVLVVTVRERPSIASIKIEGTSEISEDDLKGSLKGVGLAEGRILNRSLLISVAEEIKRQYFSRGRYSVKVNTTVTPMDKNRAGIVIDVKEGKVARIREINIVGNAVFDDKTLLKLFTLSEPGWFTFFTSADQYAREKLVADTEALRNYYQNNGYLEFNIKSTQVSISPDKENIYITVNIEEGDRYHFSGYRLAGRLPVPEGDVHKLIDVKSGEVFSRKRITEISNKITERLGEDGYAFANVNPIPDIDKQARTVFFTFSIDSGKRAYVRRINFTGNGVTRDEVLRREMRQLEGGWYSPEKVKRSRVRLQRLGFFDSVNIETPQVPGTDDQVDVNVSVKERATGNLLFGVGYSDSDGFLINGSVTEKNLFGTGKELVVSFDNSQSTKHVNLRYVNPYYTDSGIERGFNVYGREVDAEAADTAPYVLSTTGVGVFFRLPTSETQSLRWGLDYEGNTVTVSPDTTGSKVAQDFVATYGETTGAFRTTVGWAYDSLNSALFPSEGLLSRLSLEVTIPGSELEYYRANVELGAYFPLGKFLTLRSKLEVGYGDAYGDDTQELPFYKNYFAGGSSSLRGFESRSLGPRDINTDQPVGGNRRALVNFELFMPVFGLDNDDSGMRLSLFLDGGMVYGTDQDYRQEPMRYSGGAAFYWFSPIGPLSFSYGVPLNEQPGDEIERVQFSIGVPLR